MTRSRNPGRTSEAIAAAASSAFARHGYAAVSVRDIAAEAGVDPALVIRRFGSKQDLFLQTMQLELEYSEVLNGPVETVGKRIVAYVLDSDQRVREVFVALVRASDAAGIGSRLRDAHETAFVEPFRERLTGTDAGLRARLAAALIGGLLYSLWIVEDETLLTLGRDALVERYGTLVQHAVTPAP